TVSNTTFTTIIAASVPIVAFPAVIVPSAKQLVDISNAIIPNTNIFILILLRAVFISSPFF
ncbi:hypothetical protein KJ806_00820, partial [Patescibacteria group bacterium]|nr:hypothetical protein [Patescibacteria group bacterium]